MEITKDNLGRKIWSVINGWGVIVSASGFTSGNEHVVVKFEEEEMRPQAFEIECAGTNRGYRSDGKRQWSDVDSELYWEEMVLSEKEFAPRQALMLHRDGDFMITIDRYRSREELEKAHDGLSNDMPAAHALRPKFICFIDSESLRHSLASIALGLHTIP